MPTDAEARGAADGNPVQSAENSPDLVGEELGDGARIWRVYDQVAREEDRERIGNWNRGLDNLALFAGLFSAVTTAFIIEAQQDTEPDYARLTFLVLNATAAGVPFKEEPFVIDPSVRLTNCLWIASLILSLTAALIAIMGKDWIGMYASRPVCNPRKWAEIRTYRVACVERWYMSGVIASAPVLLHISLVLFAAGLVVFVSQDPFSRRVALGLALAAGGLYLVTVLSAIVFPTSPFKSPATRAIRSAIVSIPADLYSLLYRPKRRPVAVLQQATLIISAAMSYPLTTELLPPGLSPRRGHSLGSIRVFLNRLFSGRAVDQPRSWRDNALLFVGASRGLLNVFTGSLPTLFRSAIDEYRYRGQGPRARPWHSSALSWLRQIDLYDRWAEVRGQPTPILMAQSLSHLNAMTQSTDVFQSVLTALGDISIGRQVAPLVSFDLKSRIAAEIRHNWPKVDLVTLSRFILADRHLSESPLIPRQVRDRFTGNDKPITSESIAFALVELQSAYYVEPTTIALYLPAIVIQPRRLWYLLASAKDYPTAIMLAERYREHLGTDQYMNLAKELRRLLVLWARDEITGTLEVDLHRLLVSWASVDISGTLDSRSGGRAGLIQLLVISLDYLGTGAVTQASALILKFLDGKEHACIVYAFGHYDSSIADAAWAALLPYHPSGTQDDRYTLTQDSYYRLEMALPLDQFMPRTWAKGVRRPVSNEQSDVEGCLIHTVLRLLFPSQYFGFAWRSTSEGKHISTLELCVRCLHTHIRRHGSALREQNELTIVTVMLEKVVLIRVTALWTFIWNAETKLTAERDVISILTTIARRLLALLVTGATDYYETGARLFRLFSFSRTTDYAGQEVTWDLGSYLRDVAGRLSTQDPSTRISLRRLISVLRGLRPLCAPRDDLRAAWEHIGLAPDDDYQESFWDAEDFELGPLLNPEAHAASVDIASSHADTTPPVVTEEWGALRWLDAAMH